MKTKIGILGIGGVGGYFGGLLAKAYFKSDEVDVIFIARGENLKVIAAEGLKIITDTEETIVFPDLVSNNPDEIGVLDYLLCATKTYDIEESLQSFKKCIGSHTVILPLYNGVDAFDRIKNILPDNEILKGCVYIISMIFSPGTIRKIGFYEKIFFGSETASKATLDALQALFIEAKMESYLVDNIEETVWEKFIFISALASTTSYLNENIGEILSNDDFKAIYVKLLYEIEAVARARGLKLPDDIVEQTILKLEKSPKNATSSMNRDLLAGNKTEVVSLTQFVVNEGIKYGIKTPVYDKISKALVS